MAPMLEKQVANIDWENQTAKQIKNLVRGLNPIMGAYSTLENKKIKLWKVDVLDKSDELFDESRKNGEVLLSNCKNGLYIKAKDGIIKVLEIQGENAKRMRIEDFLRGNSIEIGSIFKN